MEQQTVFFDHSFIVFLAAPRGTRVPYLGAGRFSSFGGVGRRCTKLSLLLCRCGVGIPHETSLTKHGPP